MPSRLLRARGPRGISCLAVSRGYQCPRAGKGLPRSLTQARPPPDRMLCGPTLARDAPTSRQRWTDIEEAGSARSDLANPRRVRHGNHDRCWPMLTGMIRFVEAGAQEGHMSRDDESLIKEGGAAERDGATPLTCLPICCSSGFTRLSSRAKANKPRHLKVYKPAPSMYSPCGSAPAALEGRIQDTAFFIDSAV